jgi:hypothetical protein
MWSFIRSALLLPYGFCRLVVDTIEQNLYEGAHALRPPHNPGMNSAFICITHNSHFDGGITIMLSETTTRWEALLSSLPTERSANEILYDPLVEEWAFAGLSPQFRQMVREKEYSDQERAILLDRLRWVVQKRVTGRDQEMMLLYLAGCYQNEIAERLKLSRSTVRRSLQETGDKIKHIIDNTECLTQTYSVADKKVRILPLDCEEDFREFASFVRDHQIHHLALGTFADLREVLVIYTPC